MSSHQPILKKVSRVNYSFESHSVFLLFFMHIGSGVFSCTDGVPEIGIERIADFEYRIDEGIAFLSLIQLFSMPFGTREIYGAK